MEYNDNFNPVYNDNDYIGDFMDNRKTIDDTKKMDIGYNGIFRMRPRSDGKLKKTKIDVYTSGDIGSSIRDAETGDYFRENIQAQSKSGWFKEEKNAVAFLNKTTKQLINFAMQNKEWCFLNSFERMFDKTNLQNMFTFIDCGEKYNEKEIDDILKNNIKD